MKMYDRYVVDSDQLAVVPVPGSKYDREREKVISDQLDGIDEENDEKRLATILKDIANDVQEGIEMEEDFPSKNENGRMPILDMSVWADKDDGYILYSHYEKPMSSKLVMHAESAQSSSCKRSVHTQEVMRRLLNSSVRLDWDTEVAPVVTIYA